MLIGLILDPLCVLHRGSLLFIAHILSPFPCETGGKSMVYYFVRILCAVQAS